MTFSPAHLGGCVDVRTSAPLVRFSNGLLVGYLFIYNAEIFSFKHSSPVTIRMPAVSGGKCCGVTFLFYVIMGVVRQVVSKSIGRSNFCLGRS